MSGSWKISKFGCDKPGGRSLSPATARELLKKDKNAVCTVTTKSGEKRYYRRKEAAGKVEAGERKRKHEKHLRSLKTRHKKAREGTKKKAELAAKVERAKVRLERAKADLQKNTEIYARWKATLQEVKKTAKPEQRTKKNLKKAPEKKAPEKKVSPERKFERIAENNRKFIDNEAFNKISSSFDPVSIRSIQRSFHADGHKIGSGELNDAIWRLYKSGQIDLKIGMQSVNDIKHPESVIFRANADGKPVFYVGAKPTRENYGASKNEYQRWFLSSEKERNELRQRIYEKALSFLDSEKPIKISELDRNLKASGIDIGPGMLNDVLWEKFSEDKLRLEKREKTLNELAKDNPEHVIFRLGPAFFTHVRVL